MRLFSACAIVLVVVGHIPSTGFNGPFDMFKPYSFPVAAFVFVAGYFYKESHEVHPFQYLKSRIKRLLIPLVAINAAYGCLVLLLKKLVGITWGALSAQTLLVMPFTDGHQFLINMPMWFIAPLFFAELLNLLIRLPFKQVSSTSLKETILLFAYLALGAIAIELGGADGLPSGWLLLVCRTLFFLACLGMGRFYARVLEIRHAAECPVLCPVACGSACRYCCFAWPIYLHSVVVPVSRRRCWHLLRYDNGHCVSDALL